jgi:hypothetical protein
LHWTASLGAGLLVGLGNWLLWQHWGKGLLRQAKPNLGSLVLRSFLKLGLLGVVLWFLLVEHFVDPFYFLIGFSFTVIGILLKGFSWKN